MNQRADDQERGESHGEQKPEGIGRTPGDTQAEDRDHSHGEHDNGHADHPPLLGDDCEREVVVRLGQEIELLRALTIANPEDAP